MAREQSRDAHTITIGAFEAFVTFARLHGVTLRMVTGAGKMAKTKKTARELAAMVMREGEREVQRPSKRRRASNWS
jgi:hypothetical protein